MTQPIFGLLPFDHSTVAKHAARRAGTYVIGYPCRGLLYPVYVGRSDSGGSGRGSIGVYGRLLTHLRREDWVSYRPKLTHFAVAYSDDPEANFEAECWHFHHHRLALNGGVGESLWSGHPHRPKGSRLVCPEPGCYHHHTEPAAAMRAHWLHDHGRSDEGFFGQDWRTLRREIAAAQWGYSTQPADALTDVLTPPLKRTVRLVGMNSRESFHRLYEIFWKTLEGLKGQPARPPWPWPSPETGAV